KDFSAIRSESLRLVLRRSAYRRGFSKVSKCNASWVHAHQRGVLLLVLIALLSILQTYALAGPGMTDLTAGITSIGSPVSPFTGLRLVHTMRFQSTPYGENWRVVLMDQLHGYAYLLVPRDTTAGDRFIKVRMPGAAAMPIEVGSLTLNANERDI